MSETLLVENDGHVRYLKLNRPDKMNALNDEIAWAIVTEVEAAAKDDSVWVIAITGEGRAFCAGLDLTGSEGNHSPLSPMGQQLDDLHWVSRFPLGLRAWCDKPVLAGVNGVAVGAGLALAMAADVRIVKRSACLMAGYPRIGGSPDGGLSYTLAQAIGYEQAMRFLLENRTVEGDEAVKLGMAGEVVEDAAFDARFREYATSLTRLSPITARLTKRVVHRATTAIDLESQFPLRTREHPPRLFERGRQGSAEGLLRKARPGVPREVAGRRPASSLPPAGQLRIRVRWFCLQRPA
jgi:2-(1,2-epoxy-1,2-dihydrophenyl)acetyl-CoA isomerase